MKFIVHEVNGNVVEKEISHSDLYRVLADLWNIGLIYMPTVNCRSYSDPISTFFMRALSFRVFFEWNLFCKNEGKNTFTFNDTLDAAHLHLQFHGEWKDDKFIPKTVLFYEKEYVKPFKQKYSNVMQHKNIGLARDIVNAFKPKVKQNKQPKNSNSFSNSMKNVMYLLVPYVAVGAASFVLGNPLSLGLSTLAKTVGLISANAFFTPVAVMGIALSVTGLLHATYALCKRFEVFGNKEKTQLERQKTTNEKNTTSLDMGPAQNTCRDQFTNYFNLNNLRHNSARTKATSDLSPKRKNTI